MHQLDTVLIKVASRCNLDCTYCYVYQGQDTSWQEQPKRMSELTIKNIVNSLVDFSKLQEAGFAIVLHGGEPLLLGANRLVLLFSSLREKLSPEKYPISIQTNGVLISNEILDICSKYLVSVSVSIDGNRRANDISRVDHKKESSFDKTVQGIELLKSHKDSPFLFAGTLTVIHPSISPLETYNFLKSLQSPNIDFLFQDGNHDHLPQGKKSFVSNEYGQWIVKILEVYLNDDSPAPIKMLDDLIKIRLGGRAIKEGKGNEKFGILIIETNGEIRKNDTLRASFEGADFFEKRPYISSNSIQSVLSSSEFLEYLESQHPSSPVCLDCKYLISCGGGMPLYRWSKSNAYNNPSVYCSDHKLVLENIERLLYSYGLLNEGAQC